MKAVQAKTKLKRVIATNIREYLPRVLMVLFVLAKEKKEGHRVQLQGDDLWFADLIRQYTGAPRPPVAVESDDPGLILFTGGTTGISKAAYATHQALIMAGMQIRAWFSATLVEWDDCFLGSLPLFHVFAAVGLQTVALLGRSPIVLIPNPPRHRRRRGEHRRNAANLPARRPDPVHRPAESSQSEVGQSRHDFHQAVYFGRIGADA